MAEPTHGEILGQIGAMSERLKAIEENQHTFVIEIKTEITSLKADNNEWKAIKAGAGVARWLLVTLIAGLAMIAGLFKTIGGQG